MKRLILLVCLAAVGTTLAQAPPTAAQRVTIRNSTDPDNAPRIITTSLASGTEDVAYSETVQLEAGVGRAPFTWSIASGSLPTGLTIGSSTGTISGTPTTAGTYNFVVRVVDTLGGTNEKALSIVIASGGGGCSPSPCIDSVSGGTLTDGETSVVIAGLGFGTKSTAAPAMWDDATSGNINTHGWDDVYQVAYTTSLNGVAMPHSHATHYIAGQDTASNGGLDVAKYVQLGSIPNWVYATYYFRMGPNWVYGGGNEDNVKWFVWAATCCIPFPALYWYDNFFQTFSGGSGTDILPGGGQVTSGTTNDATAAWIHKRYLIRAASDGTGRILLWENGTQRYNYTGQTDWGSGEGTQRLITVGGYARPYTGDSDNNSFHFADVYIDPSAAHVEIANTSTLATAPRWATQIPTAWSSTSVTVTINLGELASETAYVFVCDSTNTCTPGFAVTVGS